MLIHNTGWRGADEILNGMKNKNCYGVHSWKNAVGKILCPCVKMEFILREWKRLLEVGLGGDASFKGTVSRDFL